MVFDLGRLSQNEWQQIDKECDFEAEKAVISVKIGEIKAEERQRIFILCAEAKGARFVRAEYR
ncbi:hypothetical protein [Microvirga brassicacearum]|uniref:hypothetical protein n=1 Tax=Microvirga brassicacearum TaxID=2580413 RepID=UPI001391BB07|nr:hypothetical protein [Microvirga brassicacearum]